MTKRPNQRGLTPLLKALAHPLRHRILVALNLRVASPSELAEEFDEPLGNVAYHTKILLDNGAIEQVRTAPVRGAVEHFYRATMRPWFDEEDWALLPLSSRRDMTGEVLRYVWSDLAAASEADGFDGPETQASRTWLELDDEAYAEMSELLESLVNRALELHAEAARRLAELAPEERHPHDMALAAMHFIRAPGGTAPGEDGRPETSRSRGQDRRTAASH